MIEQIEALSQSEADAAISRVLRPDREYERAARRVRRFHFARYREEAPAPVMSTHPGPLDPQPLPVVPSPSSKQPRYQVICQDCGKPTNRRVNALRCEPCDHKARIARQNAGRAAKRVEAKGAAA